jgi:hypothetical protein
MNARKKIGIASICSSTAYHDCKNEGIVFIFYHFYWCDENAERYFLSQYIRFSHLLGCFSPQVLLCITINCLSEEKAVILHRKSKIECLMETVQQFGMKLFIVLYCLQLPLIIAYLLMSL